MFLTCQLSLFRLTHKHTGGGMRSFGAVQAITITEAAVDHMHAQLQSDLKTQIDAAQWRRSNFYTKVDKLPSDAISHHWTDPSKQTTPPFYPKTAFNLKYDEDTQQPFEKDGKTFVGWNYGQELLETDNMCDPCRGTWAQATEHNKQFKEAQADCVLFNSKNMYRKRAVSCTPLLYAAGYAFWPLMQSVASVAIYWGGGPAGASLPPVDTNGKRPGWNNKSPHSGVGYVLVNQGATEMGNGAQTGIRQACAAALNIPMGLVRIGRISTDTVPNTQSTGASTGSDINVPAVVNAAQILRERLEKMEDGLVYKEAIGEGLTMYVEP